MTSLDTLHFAFTGQLMRSGRLWRQISQAAITSYGVSAAAAAPLLFIARLGGGVRQVTLAEYVGVEGASLVRPIDQLCEAGLARREVDPTDRRANALWLTDAGNALAQQLEQALKQVRAKVFAGLTPEDFEGALRVFDALSHAAETESPDISAFASAVDADAAQ
jgi:MarR family transcriptional regulator for hemolysin